jgi:hypothetical protein
MLTSFFDIQEKINAIGKTIGIPESDLNISSSSPDDGRPRRNLGYPPFSWVI